MTDPKSDRRFHKAPLRKNLIFALIATIGLLVGLELLCRLGLFVFGRFAYPRLWGTDDNARLQFDREVGWTFAERDRFRGKLGVSRDKPKGIYRIITLGDSATRGAGVSHDETYSWRLEELLNAQNPPLRVEVLNAGVNGFWLRQMADYLEYYLLDYEPDLVVVLANPFGAADRAIDTDIKPDEIGRQRNQNHPSALVSQVNRILFPLKIYYLLKKTIRPPFDRPWTSVDEFWRKQSANLMRMRLLCEMSQTRLMIVEYVIRVEQPEGQALKTTPWNNQRTWEADFVPIYDAMKQSGYPLDALFNDMVHPSAIGHYLIARQIARRIGGLDLIGISARER